MLISALIVLLNIIANYILLSYFGPRKQQQKPGISLYIISHACHMLTN